MVACADGVTLRRHHKGLVALNARLQTAGAANGLPQRAVVVLHADGVSWRGDGMGLDGDIVVDDNLKAAVRS
jgi:hypothetical protein